MAPAVGGRGSPRIHLSHRICGKNPSPRPSPRKGGAREQRPRDATTRVNAPMNSALPNSFRSGPDERGHFGIFGGRFVAETLMPLILDLEKAYAHAKAHPAFHAEMTGHLTDH